MSQCDIADYLGLTTETVNRVMSQLRENGTISAPARGLVRIHQPIELEDVANAA
jgi:CRP-like cAMP-binding protein